MEEQQQEQVVHTFTKAVSTIFAGSEVWLSSVRFDAWIGDVQPGNLEIIYKFQIRDLLAKGKNTSCKLIKKVDWISLGIMVMSLKWRD